MNKTEIDTRENIEKRIDDSNVFELEEVPKKDREDFVEDNTGSELEKNEKDIYGLFEALLFLSGDPLPVSFFVKNTGVDVNIANIILHSLVDEYEERDGGIKLIEISGGFQFVTNRKYADKIRKVMGFNKKVSLSRGMLETLAIIAYKQPAILAEIDELRGVSSRVMVGKLMEMSLIKPMGRKNLPGRPLLYGTTDDFLISLGLKSLTDLPKLSEIKELSVENDE